MYTEDYKFSERLKLSENQKVNSSTNIGINWSSTRDIFSVGEWNVRTRIRIRCEISKYLWDYYRLFAGTKPYSIISSLPLEQLDLTNIANFSKDEFDILKHSIAVSVARNKIKATELKDRVIEKNQLSEKMQNF